MSFLGSKLGAVVLMTVLGLVVVSAAVSAQSGRRVVKVLAKEASLRYQDKAPKGESRGDVIVGSDVLRNAVRQFGKPKGAVVGRDNYRIVFSGPQAASITVTARLPGGTVRCKGPLNYSRDLQVLRVVGATGVFRGAKGTCEARSAAKKQTLNTYKLQLPG